jgi:hypothetical protein
MDFEQEIVALKERVKKLENLVTMADLMSGFKISEAVDGLQNLLKKHE